MANTGNRAVIDSISIIPFPLYPPCYHTGTDDVHQASIISAGPCPRQHQETVCHLTLARQTCQICQDHF